jgi:hypothetical protein
MRQWQCSLLLLRSTKINSDEKDGRRDKGNNKIPEYTSKCLLMLQRISGGTAAGYDSETKAA